MNRKHWKLYAFFILLAEAVGGLSGFLTRIGVDDYTARVIKPALSPPALVFPIVWTILYALMGVSAARVYRTPASNLRTRGLGVWLLQLGVNFFWSILFFNAKAYGLSLLWLALLWGLILWMILLFWRSDKPAARLQVPYLLWVTFAAYLNGGVWALNG